LAGILQQKLGHTKEQSEEEVSDILSTLERKFAPQKVSDKLNDTVDKMKSKFKKS
jgi:trimethylamine:corrinoid methyltransferase-like protein